MCEQEVMTGLLKKSLHTWHRRADSTRASLERGVPSQSVESGMSYIYSEVCYLKLVSLRQWNKRGRFQPVKRVEHLG